MNLLLQLYPGDRVAWIVTSVLIQSTLISAAALLFVQCFARHRPALRHGVLVCALLSCLVSPVLTVTFDLCGVRLVELPAAELQVDSDAVLPAAVAEGELAVNADTDTNGSTNTNGSGLAGMVLEDPFNEFAAEQPASSPVSSPTNNSSARRATGLLADSESLRVAGGAVAAIWLTVGLVLLGRLLHGWRVVSRLRRDARPLTDKRVAAVLRSVLRNLGMNRAPVLACSAGAPGPITVGTVQPVVLLPDMLVDSASDCELRHLLLHECAHVMRCDCLTGLVQRFAQILYWPHPLLHAVNRQVATAREEVCDNYVLLSSERTEYGRTLFELSELYQSRRAVPAAIGLLSRRGNLEQRIHGILDPRRTLMTRMRYSLSIVFMCSFLCVVVPIAGTRVLPTEAAEDVGQEPAKPQSDKSTVDDSRLKSGGAVSSADLPRIVSTSPKVGATDIDPAITEITITFDRDMSAGFSWTGGGEDFPPSRAGQKVQWRDKRTCALPVELKAARYYRVGINSTSFQNFKSSSGVSVQPSAIYFATTGASEEVKNRTKKPQIVALIPPNGATDVDSGLKEIRVTFSVPMGGGFSWTGGGARFPKIPSGRRPQWSEDGKTCVLPVDLKPDWEYRLGLNSPSHKNFQSAAGIPLEPIRYTFKTREK